MKKQNLFRTSALMLATVAATNAAVAQDKAAGDSTSFTVYGFARLDTIYDFKAQSTGDWASFLMLQPGDGAAKGGTYMTARASRMGVKGALSGGTVKYQIEADLNGTDADMNESAHPGTLATNSTGVRLRHANIETGNWLFGQAWSTAFDGASMPETVEFNPVLTAVAIRQPQVRYTADLGQGASWSVAAENAAVNGADFGVSTGGAAPNNHSKSPDFTTRFSKYADWGHVSLFGVMRKYTQDNGTTSTSANGSLLGLGGSVNAPSGRLVYGVTSGNGAGRYQWGSLLQGATLVGNNIKTFKTTAYHVGYTQNWTGGVRSNIAYATMKFANDSAINGLGGITNIKNMTQMQINTFFPITKGVEAGVEYETGKRDDINTAGVVTAGAGKESRINFVVVSNF